MARSRSFEMLFDTPRTSWTPESRSASRSCERERSRRRACMLTRPCGSTVRTNVPERCAMKFASRSHAEYRSSHLAAMGARGSPRLEARRHIEPVQHHVLEKAVVEG